MLPFYTMLHLHIMMLIFYTTLLNFLYNDYYVAS